MQKQFSIDDGFLFFGAACLICAVAILFANGFTDKVYLVEAAVLGLSPSELPLDFPEQALTFEKLIIVILILSWCSIVSVKFCFLFLFRKLVDRVRPLVIYWWVVTLFNAAVSAYGVSVYILACPYFNDFERHGK